MRTSNLANQATRQSDVGHVWVEKITNSSGTLELQKYSTFRVRAAGASTVTIDGVLAATMVSGEIIIFNTGSGSNDAAGNAVPTVTVVITGTTYVQVARDKDR
jgi:hypothetical protein